MENTCGERNADEPTTDHWGQPVEHYSGGYVGAGEKRQCQRCKSRQCALIAATKDTSATKWEEFYRCEDCGGEGSFRESGGETTWTGVIDYPKIRTDGGVVTDDIEASDYIEGALERAEEHDNDDGRVYEGDDAEVWR